VRASSWQAAGSVLLVDDDTTFLSTFSRELERREWRVATADNGAAATDAARRHRPTVIVLDLMLGEESGLELIESLRACAPGTRIVLTTGHPSLQTAVEAMRLGAHHYVPKPCSVDRVLAAAATQPAWMRQASADASLAQSERAHIERVVAACNGNISEAARRLGMHRRSLQRKLRKNVGTPNKPDEP
jgi:two-component system response regulator RegA